MIKKQTKNQSIYAYHFGFIVMDRRSYFADQAVAFKSERVRFQDADFICGEFDSIERMLKGSRNAVPKKVLVTQLST